MKIRIHEFPRGAYRSTIVKRERKRRRGKRQMRMTDAIQGSETRLAKQIYVAAVTSLGDGDREETLIHEGRLEWCARLSLKAAKVFSRVQEEDIKENR